MLLVPVRNAALACSLNFFNLFKENLLTPHHKPLDCQRMKTELLDRLHRQNFRLYPRDNGDYLVYHNGRDRGTMNVRQLGKLARYWNRPATRPRLACKSPRPGCSCCDFSKSIVKVLDRRAQRRQNNLIEIDE